jgi:glyoxylase I family protein
MLEIKNIHHVAVLTNDYLKSKKFYTKILGFRILAEVYREEKKSWKLDLAIDGIYQIELFSFPEFKERASFPEAKGLRHLAFSVPNVDDAFLYLKANKVKVEPIRIDEYTGKKFVFFYDPNNQPLELYEM